VEPAAIAQNVPSSIIVFVALPERTAQPDACVFLPSRLHAGILWPDALQRYAIAPISDSAQIESDDDVYTSIRECSRPIERLSDSEY